MFKPKGTIMENLEVDPIFDGVKPGRPIQVLEWAQQISTEYEICLFEELFEPKKPFLDALISPLGNDYNHIIAVVFSNVEIDGKVTEFFLDKNGLHFYKFPFNLKTTDYGIQVHTVYRSEYEALAWVETKAFHKGNTHRYTRYILGSEKPYTFDGEDFETIYHG